MSSSTSSSNVQVSGRANCYQCNKKTDYAVTNHHAKYSHCAFYNRPYCQTCWAPVSGNGKVGILGDSISHSKWDANEKAYIPY